MACHDLCARHLRSSFIPKRALKIYNDEKKKTIRLSTATEHALSGYAALSYCWGQDAPSLQLTQDSLSSLSRDGISLEQLPLTLRDACELCIALRIRFIWIDRLCILQDSSDDWAEQSAVMGSIFGGAEVTIQAAAGTDCHYGLFAERSWKSQSTAKLKCKVVQGMDQQCFIRGPIERDTGEAINSRGWTLQESILSPRLLTFGATEMSAECRTSYWNESGRPSHNVQGLENVFPRPVRRKASFDLNTEGGVSEQTNSTASLSKAWRRLTIHYCRRHLTYGRDKLPAISGLAWWFSKKLPDSHYDCYLAGVWKHLLPAGLLWYHDLPLYMNAKKPDKYRAPSWSWASLDCNYLQWFNPSAGEKEYARILDWDVTLNGPDPFGEVEGGYLRISAPLKQGWLLPNNLWVERFDFWDDSWKTEHPKRVPGQLESTLATVWLDIYPETTTPSDERKSCGEETATPCHCLRIAKDYGMLVGCDDVDIEKNPIHHRWRRLGLVEFNEERGSKWWLGSEEGDLIVI